MEVIRPDIDEKGRALFTNQTAQSVTLRFANGDVIVSPWTRFYGNPQVQSHTLLGPANQVHA